MMPLKIDILCSDKNHPIRPLLYQWAALQEEDVCIVSTQSQLRGGDFLFLISCQEIINAVQRQRYRHALVIHASNLPAGRGMSPHIWQIINGTTDITVSLINAEDEVDTGDIWHQICFKLEGHELFTEINDLLFDCELTLMNWALTYCDLYTPRKQQGAINVYRRRTPNDSCINPHKTLAEQFNLLRVADSQRYPAFFDLCGKRYFIYLEKEENS
jgi:methionyl-tRNA formyltransferase